MAVLRLVEVTAGALVAAFATLRVMELANTYCQAPPLLALHALLCALAARLPGWWRVLLLAALFGLMRHRLDVEVYTAPAGTSLVGTIAVIAGASNGIGLALAHDLSGLGASVMLGCRNLTKCEVVKPKGARCLQLDLADLRSVVSFAEDVRSHVERVDFLVHNAGLIAEKGARTLQGFETSFGVMHLAHHLLTRELWGLLRRPSPSGLPARVISHASAAFISGEFRSLLVGDGAGDLRGEAMDGCLFWKGKESARESVVGSARTLASVYLGVPLPDRMAALCPLGGVYSRAKLAQVLFSQELQHRSSRAAGSEGNSRAVVAASLHPGTVRSGIVQLPDWLVRPTAMGARVLLYALLEDAVAGCFVDEMQSPHNLLLAASGDDPQAGRPPGYVFSIPIQAFMMATEGQPVAYRARLWELSELLVAPYASAHAWSWSDP